MLTDRITRVVEHPDIDVMVNSELKRLDGFVGNFKATIAVHGPDGGDEERQVDVGRVIVCTGYQEFDAARIERLGYGKLPQRHHVLRARARACGTDRDSRRGVCPSTSRSSTASAAAARSSTATAPASAA